MRGDPLLAGIRQLQSRIAAREFSQSFIDFNENAVDAVHACRHGKPCGSHARTEICDAISSFCRGRCRQQPGADQIGRTRQQPSKQLQRNVEPKAQLFCERFVAFGFLDQGGKAGF